MSHGKMHLVVEVGAEGGSLSLFASESLVVPEYVLTIIDQTLLFIDEGGVIEGERGRATSWRGALRLLDQYPWHMPYPLHVHQLLRTGAIPDPLGVSRPQLCPPSTRRKGRRRTGDRWCLLAAYPGRDRQALWQRASAESPRTDCYLDRTRPVSVRGRRAP